MHVDPGALSPAAAGVRPASRTVDRLGILSDRVLSDGRIKRVCRRRGCVRSVRQVDEAGDAPLRIEGEVYTERHLGPVRTAVRVVELCTLLPFLGLPFPGA